MTVDAIVVLRSDFSRRIWSPDGAPIQVIVNGTDANTARIVGGYMDGTWQSWLAQRAVDRASTHAAGRRSSSGSGSTPRSAAATSSCPG